MEPTLNNCNILVKLWIISAVCTFSQDLEIVPIIDEVFKNFNFFNKPGLLQFWACSSAPPNSENAWFTLTLANQPFVLTDTALEDHRRGCFANNNRLVGLEGLGNWFAGRAAQTGIADHRIRHFVQDPRHADTVGKGQLVLPVFRGQGAEKKLLGIIEHVTIEAKESYSEDFEQLCQLLQPHGLRSKYMGMIIKVEYNKCLIKFRLPYWARLTDLRRKVRKRSDKLGLRNFDINYNYRHNNNLISSDLDLQLLMAESNRRRDSFIEICVEHVA